MADLKNDLDLKHVEARLAETVENATKALKTIVREAVENLQLARKALADLPPAAVDGLLSTAAIAVAKDFNMKGYGDQPHELSEVMLRFDSGHVLPFFTYQDREAALPRKLKGRYRALLFILPLEGDGGTDD